MCGLVGVAGDCTLNMKDVFTQLLLVDVVRGHHSTGAALVKRYENQKILMEKGPLPSPEFIRTKEYGDLINTVGAQVLIGHNRYATVGEKNVANSHPFQFDGLVGAHNGTLDHWNLKHLPESEKFGTDSEALYNSVHKVGIKETMAQLTGAWALTWFDKATNSINLLRNSKRPLYYAYSADRCTLFWASEADMLLWVLSRNNVKSLDNEVYMCTPDNHYRWALPKAINEKFSKPLLTEVKEKQYTRQNFSYGAAYAKDNQDDYLDPEWFQQNQAYSGHRYVAPPPTTNVVPMVKAKAPPSKIDTKKFRPPYKDAHGHIINKEKFNKLVATGCVFCDETKAKWGEFIHPMKDDLDGRKLYLCEGCYNDDDIRELIDNAM